MSFLSQGLRSVTHGHAVKATDHLIKRESQFQVRLKREISKDRPPHHLMKNFVLSVNTIQQTFE